MSGSLIIPILAIISGLLLGGLIVALTTEEVYTTFAQSPLQAIQTGLRAAWSSYVALFTGAIGDPARMIAAIQAGEAEEIRRAFNPFFESLVQSTPYIFAGLAVALGFRAGLFNIGAEGQLFVGAMTGVWVGFAIKGLPPVIHIPVGFVSRCSRWCFLGLYPRIFEGAYRGA